MVKRGQKLKLPSPGRIPAGMRHCKHHLLSPANKPLQGAAGLTGRRGGKFYPCASRLLWIWASAFSRKCKLLLTLSHVTKSRTCAYLVPLSTCDHIMILINLFFFASFSILVLNQMSLSDTTNNPKPSPEKQSPQNSLQNC